MLAGGNPGPAQTLASAPGLTRCRLSALMMGLLLLLRLGRVPQRRPADTQSRLPGTPGAPPSLLHLQCSVQSISGVLACKVCCLILQALT